MQSTDLLMGRAANISESRGPCLLQFGPQAVSFSNQSISQLKSELKLQPWAVKTLIELPSIWQKAANHLPSLGVIPGDELLEKLHRWLTNESPADDIEDLPNTILSPLTTLSHLIQYRHYIDFYHGGSPDPHLAFKSHGETACIGLCTGMLASFATASAATLNDWERQASTAVRLAALVGFVVDAAEKSHVNGPSECYGASWQGPQDRLQLDAILAGFPNDAYVSVWYDKFRATITVSKRSAPSLLEQLQKAGIMALPTKLHGRFHSDIHRDTLESLVGLCDSEPDSLRFRDAVDLSLRTYTNNGDDQRLQQGPLHEFALQAILVQQCDWYGTFSAAAERYNVEGGSIVSISNGPGIPPSLIRKLGARVHHCSDVDVNDAIREETLATEAGLLLEQSDNTHETAQARDWEINDRDIAIVGMSIKVAGADDLIEYEDIIREGKSQHQEVPSSRVPFGNNPWRRSDDFEDRKWYGNFIRDADCFDHKFFRKSPRESAAMDPQQRLILQAAYQAVQQSGYYHSEGLCGHNDDDYKHVGVFLGTCATDYDKNAACHSAGAFTVTGLLRGFISGRVSHYFGWTGPSMTFDTACSGSAVAIHSAVKAILSGECRAALAGGVNTLGDEVWFQNLAGASFLSPTGQCKPFDDAGDGYCRGEGIACVFLKPMSAAIADGDQILGKIASTAVYQNHNSTPLFVPNSPSLSRLFRDVLKQAQLKPEDISLIEAHGTGTPVGDPAEYTSIRDTLAGSTRRKPLALGSVKGLVGHTESTSGVVSLIKVILLMQGEFIPPQPSHSKMSHLLHAKSSDMIEVPTQLRPWSEQYKAALINNYGASGSNAAMVVTQGPQFWRNSSNPRSSDKSLPFWIPGFDGRSIEEYCAKLLSFIKGRLRTISLEDFCFNINRQSNRTLSHALHFRCSSVDELVAKLSPETTSQHAKVKSPRPVILCFGGQNSKFIGLDRNIYETVPLVKHHLDECDKLIQSIGLKSIYPDIFANEPVADTVQLQTMLFSIQYACAKCWMDCGVTVEAVVGHSFGEITALCISEVLSVVDALKLVSGRAAVVRDFWGADCGVMMAVDGELDRVQYLLEESNRIRGDCSAASIACYNGPTSFTLAGSKIAMDIVAETLKRPEFATIKGKKLNVTNAFHSALVEPLLAKLEAVGAGLKFRQPSIHLERATATSFSHDEFTKEFVSDHMRNPVFFHHAVQRLSQSHPSAVWLEAGSASKITSLARRSVHSVSNSYFQSLTLTGDRGIEQLTDATLSLWREGLPVTYWAHHRIASARLYRPLLLPPYQFEKIRHWLDLKPPPLVRQDHPFSELWTFDGYVGMGQRCSRFKINTESETYKSFVMPHVAAQTAPICPATLEYNMAIEALFSLLGDKGRGLHPIIRDMRNDAPLCVNRGQSAWLELEVENSQTWAWRIMTTAVGQKPDSQNSSSTTICVIGRLELVPVDDVSEFSQYEKQASHADCVAVLEDFEGAESGLQGKSVYRALADVVDYGELYRRARQVVGRKHESAGVVARGSPSDIGSNSGSWLDDVPVVDSFSQVAGVWVNCMAEREPGDEDIFLATGCEIIMSSPKITRDHKRLQPGRTWHVLAKHHRESDKDFRTDVYVFDAVDGELIEVQLGIKYHRIPKVFMRMLLDRSTESEALLMKPKAGQHINDSGHGLVDLVQENGRSTLGELKMKIKSAIASVSGVDAKEINDDSALADLGIDSLASMELVRELENMLGIKLGHSNLAELIEATANFREFVSYMTKVVYGDDYNPDPVSENGKESSDNGSIDTPITSGVISPMTDTGDPMESMDKMNLTSVVSELGLPQLDVLTAFALVKASTDQRIKESHLNNTNATIIARSNRLCTALVVDAFEQLGCSIRAAIAGQPLDRIKYPSQHSDLVNWLYGFLEKDARLINIDGDLITRSSNAAPQDSSDAIFQGLLQADDSWLVSHKVANYAGKSLAAVLGGKTDGIRVLFGSPEGRELVRGLYCDLPFNRLFYKQISDTIRLAVENLTPNEGPLRILEMGAGTGGTTHILAPMLASLNIPVVYTFTDLSPSMIAQARRNFGSKYQFMKFLVHDIEKVPEEPLLGNQHIVVASNAIHATADLTASAANIRKALRSDGVLLMTEMTESLPFVDIVFGLLEGWWRFADGRVHAIVPADHWRERLLDAGFRHVDWTDGNLSENKTQKVIMAMVSEFPDEGSLWTKPEQQPGIPSSLSLVDVESRETEAEKYIQQYAAGFELQGVEDTRCSMEEKGNGAVVLITGATGSLGSHLVSRFAENTSVSTVICLNRPSNGHKTPLERQNEAFASRGIVLPPAASSKLRLLATDITQPNLGLSTEVYSELSKITTHVVHNAWPMSASRPLRSFEPQIKALRQLIDFAAEASASAPNDPVCFQFVSSIGVAGVPPPGTSRILEDRVRMCSVLPNGYCAAKWACERLLEETLHRNPRRFRPMAIRPGQIAGSSLTGFWNPVEHFPFLVRSSQALRAFPAFEGRLQWFPVDRVAETIVDLALNRQANYPIYHIDNPVGQSWEDMVSVLAEELDIPSKYVIPFHEWILKVRRSPLALDKENPAARLVEFLEENFERMSCGGIILDTAKTAEHSPSFAAQGPVSATIARKYVRAWKETGFLRW